MDLSERKASGRGGRFNVRMCMKFSKRMDECMREKE
jgi:hypothetical protein